MFWDVNPNAFDPAAYPDYAIFRVLEYGDQAAVDWMREMFSEAGSSVCFAPSAD